VTPFSDLNDYVAIPAVTSLRLSPDGSWLAAAVQTPGPWPALAGLLHRGPVRHRSAEPRNTRPGARARPALCNACLP
jgi:hypothetical protein